jgi:hypothetical protein
MIYWRLAGRCLELRLLNLVLSVPGKRRHAGASLLIIDISVQAMCADILDDASGEQVMHAHSLADELADGGRRNIVCDQLLDHMNVFAPVLAAEFVAQLLQRRQCVFDRGSAALDHEHAVLTENVVQIFDVPYARLLLHPLERSGEGYGIEKRTDIVCSRSLPERKLTCAGLYSLLGAPSYGAMPPITSLISWAM